MLGFGDCKEVPASGLPGTFITLEGAGCWLLGLDGARFHEIYAPSRAALLPWLAECKAAVWQTVPARAFPRWLDCFDNAGPGVWVGGGGDQYDLPADFEWLRDHHLAMCTLSPTQSRLVGPGTLDTSIFDWHTAMAAKYDLPYRLLSFPADHEWLWNRIALPYVLAEPGRTVTAPWLDYEKNSCAAAMEPVPAVDPYVFDLRRRLSEHLASDANLVGQHGCTEIPDAGVDILASMLNTPGTKQRWHDYLNRELGMDLATVSQLHKGARDFYRSWDQVEVPRPGDFIGWNPATCLNLCGQWQMHEDVERHGTEQAWFDPAKAPDDWVEGNCNDPLIQVYTPKRRNGRAIQPDFWMRRSVDIAPGGIGKFLFLHISRDAHHGIHSPGFEVWVNGRKLIPSNDETRGFDQCLALDGALREGSNQVVFNTHGAPVPGYCFFGASPFLPYPAMSATANRLWFDAVNFDAWLRVGKIESALCASRSADPNRPLKMMATINLLDLTTPLCERLGVYQHDTGGAGAYWAPMSGARLARSHGLPWSCEQGGPPKTVAAMQAAMTYYLMYGNDAVDLVFAVSHYRNQPEVSAWVDHNINLVHCVGKMSLPPPQIGVLRSSRATRLGFREPWNWDIGRGALQAVGRNFAYLEVPDILNGTIDQFPVVIDDGTILLDEKEIAGIKRYVQRGGIFVAQHHTGQHSPAAGDSWQLAKAWNLTVTPKYLLAGESYHKWPLAKMRFSTQQDLLPSARGKEMESCGVAVSGPGSDRPAAGGIAATAGQVRPVASWDDGSMAIADVHDGSGRFILLGAPFYIRMKDAGGAWYSDERGVALLDEFLTALGVARDSITGHSDIWAERWRSKNGIYDLYPVARLTQKGAAIQSATVRIRRETPISSVVEVSSLGHPHVPVTYQDGHISLPATDYGLMQTRIYLAPRADIARAALDWFQTQARIWRALPPVPAARMPRPIATPGDLLPLADGWTLKLAGQADRIVRLGAFGTLGVPENAQATFEKTIVIPKAWQGQRVDLVFDAEHWFWGILPQARLRVNGTQSAITQPIIPMAAPGFSCDVTAQAGTGSLTLSLVIDGSATRPAKSLPPDQKNNKQPKPNGVNGLFYLQATTPALKIEPLAGLWFVASAFNRLQPVTLGARVKGLYLETHFRLPVKWPAKRVFLQSSQALGFLVINGRVLQAPPWMKALDVSGLVDHHGGENTVRWIPAARNVAAWGRPYAGTVADLNLAWTP